MYTHTKGDGGLGFGIMSCTVHRDLTICASSSFFGRKGISLIQEGFSSSCCSLLSSLHRNPNIMKPAVLKRDSSRGILKSLRHGPEILSALRNGSLGSALNERWSLLATSVLSPPSHGFRLQA
ncbi:uncharacterized protein LDX57_008847 [Aspergillus melleus]|uniref:uncharacterized protein n=1 Tax=Aspergillus melleus TaxID=138277 RepID=UPI001E8E62C1|nr:uncharacterized protein LDX57_008847 [Aspergillus melleus]KAH8431188.1 hypothetical protein LDX57_008847 [Aspergillus melleus]